MSSIRCWKSITADDQRFDAEICQLAGQQTTFRVVAAKVDDIDIFSLQACRQRAEILVAGGNGIVDDFLDATLVERCLEGVRQTFAIGALVVDDGNALVLQAFQDIVAATSACWSSRPQVRRTVVRPRLVRAGVVAVGVTMRMPFSANAVDAGMATPR